MKTWVQISIAILLVLFIFFAGWEWIDWVEPEVRDRGEFGDKFGMLNALFSALAFAIIIVSLLVQSKDLKTSIDEIKNNQTISLRQVEMQKLSAKISGLGALLNKNMQTFEIATTTMSKLNSATHQEDKDHLNSKISEQIKELSNVTTQLQDAIRELENI